MVIDPATTKYLIKAHIKADGIIEKSDVVGAIFGQTEGLLGDELDLRELQRSARVGRIEVELESKNGKSEGDITLPTSLDKVETVILAAAFESIDRVGPCKAVIIADSRRRATPCAYDRGCFDLFEIPGSFCRFLPVPEFPEFRRALISQAGPGGTFL